jgi:tetratricopeptide (TPR) repeat protein
VGLRALLERAWSGVAAAVGVPTAAELFRAADRLRQEGRHHAAAELVQEGLRRSPGSPAGHILDAYLHVASRRTATAREAFKRALALDPEHPRALLGLARISLEEGDGEAARRYLGRAIAYHPEFPEAHELSDRLSNGSRGSNPHAVPAAVRAPAPPPLTPSPAPGPAPRRGRVPLPPGGRDMVVTQLGGAVLLSRCDRARQQAVARHAAAVVRLAAPMLARAGLGPLCQAALEGADHTVLLRADHALVLSVAVPSGSGVRPALGGIQQLWADTVGDRRW